jgi:hypothetical protein
MKRRLAMSVAIVLMLTPFRLAGAQSADTTVRDDSTSRADSTSGVPQVDVLDLISRILGKPPDTIAITPAQTAGFRIALLPAVAVTPTTGLLLGVVSALSFGAGQAPGTTLSVISSLVYFTALRQFGLQTYGTVFTRNNRLLLQADWRYLNTSQPTYGLGGIQPTANQSNMNFDLIRFQQALMKRIAPHLYAGGGYDYDAYVRIDDRGDTAGHVTPFLTYNNGQPVTQTVTTGPEVAALHDTRSNPINSMSGSYLSARIAGYPTALGSSSDWATMVLDLRTYLHPAKWWRGILALRSYDWFTVGRPPYMELPAIGWDRESLVGRGYGQGRIRGSQFVYGEGEERMPVTANGLIGLAFFVNVSSFANPTNQRFSSLDPAGGVGLRLKFNKATDQNVRFDFGWGKDGSHGLWLGLGEAF